MKRFSKIFAVVMALAMLTSVFCFPSSAMIADSSLDVSVDLEKVTTPGEVVCADTGSDATELGNIYKVTLSFKTVNAGLSRFQASVVYDDTLFDVCYGDGTDNFIAYTVGDGSEFGWTAACTWLGAAADADAYASDGTGGQTSSLKIKAYGLKHASAGTTYVAEKIDYSTEQYTNVVNWAYPGEEVPANRGAIIASYTCSMTCAKALVLPMGEQEVVSIYLMLKDGKTDADVEGTELRVSNIDYSGVAVSNMTAYGSLYGMAKTATQDTVASETPDGLVYTYTAPSPVYNKTSQIRYTGAVVDDGDDATTDYAPFDIRSRAALSAEDFATICGDDTAAESAITAVGFVFADATAGTFDMAAAKAVVESKTDSGIYKYVECTEIVKNTTDGDYFWSCLVTGAEYEGEMNAMGFITVGDKTYYVDAAQYTDFNVLYDTYAANIPA